GELPHGHCCSGTGYRAGGGVRCRVAAAGTAAAGGEREGHGDREAECHQSCHLLSPLRGSPSRRAFLAPEQPDQESAQEDHGRDLCSARGGHPGRVVAGLLEPEHGVWSLIARSAKATAASPISATGGSPRSAPP